LSLVSGFYLSASFDAAFDRHLISFDETYRMIRSPVLKDYYSNRAVQDYFKSKEGRQLVLPKRYQPDQSLLEKHRLKLCA
jgi:putative restriction endonuclease